MEPEQKKIKISEEAEVKLPVYPDRCDGRVALITGITGQDGSYLAEFLLEKGYAVHGIIRRSSSFNTNRIEHLYSNKALTLHYGDLGDASNLTSIISNCKPDEIYNLGAMSHVKVSFEMPEYTAEVDGVGTLRLLDAVRSVGRAHCTKVYQASTSELYGKVREVPQTETTPFYPRSPYAVAKQFSFWIMVNYREAYGMFLTNGILFNHEGPRRGPTFVTRKITRAVARISKGLQEKVVLGNIDSKRDWGHAKDYVRGMWMMMQADVGDDFVLATNETHSVREFIEKAFEFVGIPITWQGEGVNEKGLGPAGQVLVEIAEKYFRPTEVDLLIGDPSKAKRVLGWEPAIKFEELVKEMMEADLQKVEAGDLIN